MGNARRVFVGSGLPASQRRQKVAEVGYWIAAVAVAGSPTVLAADFGGILPWTQHVGALALVTACFIAFLSRLVSIGCPTEVRWTWKSFTAAILLVMLAGYAFLQTVPLPPSLVAWLSPASHSAWTVWASSVVSIAPSQWLPVSIAPFDSRQAISFLIVVVVVSFYSVFLFQDRRRILLMMSLLAFGACSVAIIGIARKLIPGFDLWSFQVGGEGAPFGTFLNRNNAALAINTGLAAAMGLVVWRRSAISISGGAAAPGIARAERSSESMGVMFRDPTIAVALSGMLVCLLGLIACGSRGGLLSAVVGGWVVAYFMRRNSGRLLAVFAATMIVAAVAFLVLRTGTLGERSFGDNTFEQLESTIETGGGRLSADTRLIHWPDGVRAAVKHLPVGSGLATYGFAYLPWQESGPWRHCVHADNLWLEMFVELGIGGLCFAAATVILLVRSLMRLSRSTDALDQGLMISGVFLGTVILISQIFDFGLIVPANLIAITIFFSVAVARSTIVLVAAANGSSRDTNAGRPRLVLLDQSGRWWQSPLFLRERLPQAIGGAVLLLMGVAAVVRLELDSRADFFVRTCQPNLRLNQLDSARLEAIAAEAYELVQRHAHPGVLTALADLEFQLGRLDELSKMSVSRLPEDVQIERYLQTSESRRRLGWRKSVDELSEHVSNRGAEVLALPVTQAMISPPAHYARAQGRTEAAIRSRPLSFESRVKLVYLEFVHQQPGRTRLAVRQAADLFRRTPELQLRFGSLAADHGDYETASELWRRTIALDQAMIRRVLNRAIQLPDFPVWESIPESPEAKEIASSFLRSVQHADAR